MGGVVLDHRPEGWVDNGKVMVFIHGGAYRMSSAWGSLTMTAPLCRITGLRIVSIDYTLAPFAIWKGIQDQAVSVFLSTSVRLYQALEAAGHEVKLDAYEGMWHVFQGAAIPETDVSYRKIDVFRMAAVARTHGVDSTLIVDNGMWHVSVGDGSSVPELQQAYDEMIRFLIQHLGV